MPSYTPPLRDMQFVMNEVLDVPTVLKSLPTHAELDADTIAAVLEEGGKFASEVLMPLNQVGDKQGCQLDIKTHEVTTPKGFKDAFAQFAQGGWPALSCDPAYGGQGLPIVVNQCFYEMLNSANQAWTMYPGLTHGAYASLATHGRDIKFDLNRAEGYKNFCNKLWNGARFVLMHCEDFSTHGAPPANSQAERWLLAQLAQTSREVETHFAEYRFDLASTALYEFTWNTYCDWFLEFAKPALVGDDKAAADSMRHTLLFALEATLCLLHPVIPFITEEIWHAIAPKLGITGDTISNRSYPKAADFGNTDAGAVADIEWLKAVVGNIRRIRSEMNIAPGKTIPLLWQTRQIDDRKRMANADAALKFLARLESIDELSGEAPAAATALVGELQVFIPLVGLIDLDAEKSRLAKELKRIEGEIGKCRGKLSSDTFVANAPPAVVAKERERLAANQSALAQLQAQLIKLG